MWNPSVTEKVMKLPKAITAFEKSQNISTDSRILCNICFSIINKMFLKHYVYAVSSINKRLCIVNYIY